MDGSLATQPDKLLHMLFIRQVVRDDQLARMKACGAIANIQPSFVPADAAWAEECLPQKLLDASYPWKTLMESGNPTNMIRLPNVILLLAHRPRRWPNSKPTLGQRLLAENDWYPAMPRGPEI